MPGSWIITRERDDRPSQYIVRYRLGGRGAPQRHGGSFRTKTLALARKRWIDGELAHMRVPDLAMLEAPAARPVSLREIAESWRTSRVDVSEGTAATHRVNLGRILKEIGDQAAVEIQPADVAALVATLHAGGLKRESIRKTIATLAMVLDFAKVVPNPARDRDVKLPREDKAEVNPPTANHVEAVHAILANTYGLELVVLDATGMRVGELEALTWGDVDEQSGRWRVTATVAKTSRARWVPVPDLVFEAVIAAVPREDRDLEGQVFAGFGADRFRTALTRACKTAGVPAMSPHDLRHRRATMWHLSGVPVVEAAAWLGHSPTEHLRTYAHATLVDRSEVDAWKLLGCDRQVRELVRA